MRIELERRALMGLWDMLTRIQVRVVDADADLDWSTYSKTRDAVKALLDHANSNDKDRVILETDDA